MKKTLIYLIVALVTLLIFTSCDNSLDNEIGESTESYAETEVTNDDNIETTNDATTDNNNANDNGETNGNDNVPDNDEASPCGHSGGTATCKAKAVCALCNEPYGAFDANNHTGTQEWVKTNTTHKKVYNCCNLSTIPETTHGWNDGVCEECEYECSHNFDSNICTYCGNILRYSQGLEFTQTTIEFDTNKYAMGYAVTGIGNCTDTDVIIPPRYNDGAVISIGEFAFAECYDITSINVPIYVMAINASTFIDCERLTSITVDESNEYYKSIDGNLYTKDGKTIIKYSTGKTDATFDIPNVVENIGDFAFSCYNDLTINISTYVTSINDYAFEYSAITSITVDEDNTNYKSIDGNLYTKDGKTIIKYSNRKTASTFEIPNSVTSIGNYAFSRCFFLENINIPNSVTSIGNHAFQYSDIKSINIPNSVTSIGQYAFSHCSSLASATISNKIMRIESGTFFECSSLESINIPDGVASIGSQAFQLCYNLESITMPNSVTSINLWAFRGCSNLSSIDFNGTKAQWNTISKGGGWNNDTGDYTIHCTDGDIEKS